MNYMGWHYTVDVYAMEGFGKQYGKRRREQSNWGIHHSRRYNSCPEKKVIFFKSEASLGSQEDNFAIKLHVIC